MVTGRPLVIMIAGEFTTFAAEVTGLVNMESVASRRQFGELGFDVETGLAITECDDALDGAGLKNGNSSGSHYLLDDVLMLVNVPASAEVKNSGKSS